MSKQNRRFVDMSTGTRPKASKGKQPKRQHVNKYANKERVR